MKTAAERFIDEFLSHFEQTCMGSSLTLVTLNERHSDPNQVRGMTVGKAREIAEPLFNEYCAKALEEVLRKALEELS